MWTAATASDGRPARSSASEDGSVVIRTFYRVPDHRDGALGETSQTYLP